MTRPTRGRGLLEPLLARRRARLALRLMRRCGLDEGTDAIVDLGCGRYPLLLSLIEGGRKVGIDPQLSDAAPAGVDAVYADAQGCLDAEGEGAFAVTTSLAVLEHLTAEEATVILGQIFRLLRPGGWLVLTTPSPLGDRVLRVLARLGLVSREEIDEHQHAYSKGALRKRLAEAGFTPHTIKVRSFQGGLNQWAVARKGRQGG